MSVPAYQEVYESLSRKIITGEYPVGTLLPSEPSLEKIYHVSRITIRKAVDMLRRNGYVRAQQGVGTIVLDFCVTQNLNKITSFTQTLIKSGHTVSYKTCDISIIKADKKLAEVLSIELGADVAKIHRVVLASGKIIAVIDNYIAYQNVPGIEKFMGKFNSLYELLKQEFFISFEMSQDCLTAKIADKELASELDVKVGHPILCDERKAISGGKCLSYDLSYTRGDMYSFNLTLFN